MNSNEFFQSGIKSAAYISTDGERPADPASLQKQAQGLVTRANTAFETLETVAHDPSKKDIVAKTARLFVLGCLQPISEGLLGVDASRKLIGDPTTDLKNFVDDLERRKAKGQPGPAVKSPGQRPVTP